MQRDGKAGHQGKIRGELARQRTLAYGTVTLDPRLLRASIGVEPCTEPNNEPPVAAGAIEPFIPGTVAGVNDPPRNGSEFPFSCVAMPSEFRR
jgi:hypothetical protein